MAAVGGAERRIGKCGIRAYGGGQEEKRRRTPIDSCHASMEREGEGGGVGWRGCRGLQALISGLNRPTIVETGSGTVSNWRPAREPFWDALM